WSHEGMLDSAFPALNVDYVSDSLKGHAQIGPNRSTNQEVQCERVNLSLTHITQHLGIFANQRHAQGINNVVKEPNHLPAPIALCQVPIALEKGITRTPLM